MQHNQYETNESFQKRKWFVSNYLKYNPKSKESEAVRLSNIWINMITIGCRYPQPIESKIYSFLKTQKPK